MRHDLNNEVILIAPHTLASRILRDTTNSIRCFESVDEFERWRSGSQPGAIMFERAVRQAVIEMCGSTLLPIQLQLSFEWLSRQSRVPPLKALAIAAGSRRSFFRKWSRTIALSPRQFLDRVGQLYAIALLGSGVPLPDVLRETGLKAVPGENQRSKPRGTAFDALALSFGCR